MPSRGLDRLAGCLLLAVIVLGLVQMVFALRAVDLRDLPGTLSDFREGRLTSSLEKALDQHLPTRNQMIGMANGLRYRLTGGTGDKVRAGRDDWLFLADELHFYPEGEQQLAARTDLLIEANRRLASQGVKLVVALLPDKARVYERFLPESYPQPNRSRYQTALSRLRQGGVVTVDLLQPFEQAALHQEISYRSDTHWNQLGARMAAERIAAVVRGLEPTLERTPFASRETEPAGERIGDLINLMGLAEMPRWLRPVADQEALIKTARVEAKPAAGLFDEQSVPVVLTGTSYSLRGNFHGFLQESLAAEVLNTARDGGGFLQAATEYFQDDAFRSSKPRVVIWELPERFLAGELDGEKGWIAKLGW